jgi:hypothetical protein
MLAAVEICAPETLAQGAHVSDVKMYSAGAGYPLTRDGATTTPSIS